MSWQGESHATSPVPPKRDLPTAEDVRGILPRPPEGGWDRPRRRPKRQRQWPRMLMGALAMYGAFSLVIHAVVAWEVLR